MKRSMNWLKFALAAASLGFDGCGATVKEGGTEVGGSTHWLQKCKGNSECGSGLCYAGVCTQACTGDSQCGGSLAGCTELQFSAQDVTCTTISACFERCKAEDDCASGMSCSSAGFCQRDDIDCDDLGDRVTLATPSDAGTDDAGTSLWSVKCSDDSECGSDVCYGGVCTQMCSSNDQCEGLNAGCTTLQFFVPDAYCVTRSSACYQMCVQDDECGSGMSCSSTGYCTRSDLDCSDLDAQVDWTFLPIGQPTSSPSTSETVGPAPTDTAPPATSETALPSPSVTAAPFASVEVYSTIGGNPLPVTHYITVYVGDGFCDSNQPDGKNSQLRIHAPDGETYQYQQNPGESACNCAKPLRGSSGATVEARSYPFQGLALLSVASDCSESDAGNEECLLARELTWGEYTVEFCAYRGTLEYPAGTRDVICVQPDEAAHCVTATFNYPDDPDTHMTLESSDVAE